MRDLGMELDAEPRLAFVPERGDGGAVTARRAEEPAGERPHLIAMAHPGDEVLRRLEATEEWTRVAAHLYLGAPVLPALGRNDFAAVQVRDEVHPVADAEDRRDLERGRLGGRHVLAVNRVRAAAEDDAGWRPLANPLDGARRRMDLRVDARLTHPPRDELSVLRTVVDDEDTRAHQRRHSAGSRTRNSTS